MSEVIPTSSFKKQFKKVKNNPRWKKIFNGSLPFMVVYHLVIKVLGIM